MTPGTMVRFLSASVLIGFLTGVGIQVAIGQISGMLGIPGGTYHLEFTSHPDHPAGGPPILENRLDAPGVARQRLGDGRR